jgi:hypothetical protein
LGKSKGDIGDLHDIIDSLSSMLFPKPKKA